MYCAEHSTPEPMPVITEAVYKSCPECERVAKDKAIIHLSAENKRLRELLGRAIPLASFAQDHPRHEEAAQNWHHEVAVALSEGPDK